MMHSTRPAPGRRPPRRAACARTRGRPAVSVPATILRRMRISCEERRKSSNRPGRRRYSPRDEPPARRASALSQAHRGPRLLGDRRHPADPDAIRAAAWPSPTGAWASRIPRRPGRVVARSRRSNLASSPQSRPASCTRPEAVKLWVEAAPDGKTSPQLRARRSARARSRARPHTDSRPVPVCRRAVPQPVGAGRLRHQLLPPAPAGRPARRQHRRQAPRQPRAGRSAPAASCRLMPSSRTSGSPILQPAAGLRAMIPQRHRPAANCWPTSAWPRCSSGWREPQRAPRRATVHREKQGRPAAARSLQLDLAQALVEVALRVIGSGSGSGLSALTQFGSTSIRKSGFGCRKNGVE